MIEAASRGLFGYGGILILISIGSGIVYGIKVLIKRKNDSVRNKK